MAKAASPIRLQQDIMLAAETTARRFHRSTAEQIEYWAELGRSVASTLNPDVLLSVSAGLSRLQVEPVKFDPIDAGSVFASLEDQRKKGLLQHNVTSSPRRYQASLIQPGYLECIDVDGNVTIGQFKNGEFIVLSKNIS